jgi:hypothetical protein
LLETEFVMHGIPSLNPFNETFHPHATVLYLTEESDKDLVKWWPGEERKWHGQHLANEKVNGNNDNEIRMSF